MPSKALVIDDSPITRRVISLVLHQFSVQSKVALNGREALEILSEDDSINFVLIDWNMPEMTGIEFLETVRQQPKFENLKLIIVSANNTPESFEAAHKAGADDFITKPISRDVVANLLRFHGLN